MDLLRGSGWIRLRDPTRAGTAESRRLGDGSLVAFPPSVLRMPTSSSELRLPSLRSKSEPEFPAASSAWLSGPGESGRLDDGRELTLLEPLGKGSFTTVSRALVGPANGVQRKVAAKLFSGIATEEVDEVRAAIARAAQRTACIDHPNVVRTYDVGAWNGQPLLLTELVDGVSLAGLHEAYVASQRRLPLDLAIFIAVEIAEGLAAAQNARDHRGMPLGVLHHALSAREVLLSWRGEVKVGDFEMSVACSATSSVRSARSVANRVVSMAPEVAQGYPADARADVFAFGVLLRELLIGPRFAAGTSSGEAVRLARDGFVEPVTFQPRLPTELESVIARALEVDPAHRYPSAAALASDLRPVALAMGVGDGRYFLRKTLEREWEADGVTGQIPVVAPLMDDELEYYEGISSSSEADTDYPNPNDEL